MAKEDAMAKEVANNFTSEIDVYSPYYIHPSDNPGAMLVAQPLLGDN